MLALLSELPEYAVAVRLGEIPPEAMLEWDRIFRNGDLEALRVERDLRRSAAEDRYWEAVARLGLP